MRSHLVRRNISRDLEPGSITFLNFTEALIYLSLRTLSPSDIILAERLISKDLDSSMEYSRRILKNRFHLGEKIIASIPGKALEYALFIDHMGCIVPPVILDSIESDDLIYQRFLKRTGRYEVTSIILETVNVDATQRNRRMDIK